MVFRFVLRRLPDLGRRFLYLYIKRLYDIFVSFIDDVLLLIYPHNCYVCTNQPAITNNALCIHCLSIVSYTDHFDLAENELMLKLLGRVEIEHAAALHYFLKKGKIQKLVHDFKYKNKPQVATLLGKQFAYKYLEAETFKEADYLVPIPVHYARRQQRGYNQAYMIAKGIHEITGIPIENKVLIKNKKIVSQTIKNRSERFVNVLHSFSLKNEEKFVGKRILIIDDVFTTGATIEAAITILKDIKDIIIQVGFIAIATE